MNGRSYRLRNAQQNAGLRKAILQPSANPQSSSPTNPEPVAERWASAGSHRSSRRGDLITLCLNKAKLSPLLLREGRYLLPTNLKEKDPTRRWHVHVQIVAVGQGFKDTKGDLGIRPVHHQPEKSIEIHGFGCFPAYVSPRDPRPAAEALGTRTDFPQRTGEVRRGGDGGRGHSDRGD